MTNIDPNNVRLTFELPAELAPELLSSAANLAITSAQSVELVDIKPKYTTLTREWVDSPEPLFTTVVERSDRGSSAIQVVTAQNIAHFLEANGINPKSPGGAMSIIGALAGRWNLEDSLKPYVYRPPSSYRGSSYSWHREFAKTAGIRVDTAHELMDKMETEEIEVPRLTRGSKTRERLDAFMEKLFMGAAD